MTAKLTIELDDSVLDALQKTGSITFRIVPDNHSSSPAGTDGAKTPREGTIGARVVSWAEQRGKTFGAADVVKQFKLTRSHASMVLSRLARDGGIRRVRRGVFAAGSGAASAPTARNAKTPHEGSLPAQVLAWAAEDGEPFTTPEVMEAFGLSRGHASIVLGKLANGAYPLTRVRRGLYRYQG